MCGDEYQAAAARPLKLLVGVFLPYGGLECVYCRVAGDEYTALVPALAQKIVFCHLCGGKIEGGEDTHRLTVELLGVGGVDVVGAQTCLHVSYGDLQIEACQRGGKGSGGVAVNQTDVGLLTLKHGLDLLQYGAGYIKQGLFVFHDAQVIVGHYRKCRQHLIQHTSVLTCDADHGLQVFAAFKLVYQRAHFYRFGSRAKNHHNFFHHSASLTKIFTILYHTEA